MNTIILETVQWSSLPDVDSVDPVGERDFAVLSEIGEILKRHGCTERFGVCLLHRHFDVAEDEIAIEFTDVEARVSTVEVIKRQADSVDQLGTMWRFHESGDTKMVTVCEKVCNYNNGHKVEHRKVGR